jgi:hypothetical protein
VRNAVRRCSLSAACSIAAKLADTRPTTVLRRESRHEKKGLLCEAALRVPALLSWLLFLSVRQSFYRDDTFVWSASAIVDNEYHVVIFQGAHTASGQLAAAPPRSVMNSRRLMFAPKLRRRHRIGLNEDTDRG